MEGNMLKKALVVGIIFLFIGVGVQPVFAKDTIKTTISETLEDCRCQHISGKATMGISPPKEIDYYNLRSQGEITHFFMVAYISGKADFEVDENGRWKQDDGGVHWAVPIDLIITGYMCWSPNPWQPEPDWYCYFNKVNVLPDVDLVLLVIHYFGYAKNNRLSGIGLFGAVAYYD